MDILRQTISNLKPAFSAAVGLIENLYLLCSGDLGAAKITESRFWSST
jgi:hypothetical protein